jgi:hypothetical protein
MEEKKICNACKIEKSIESFYRCKNCRGGKLPICKTCKQHGVKVNKDHIVHPFNQMWRQPDSKFFSLSGVRKEEYELMWELLKQMGYDVNKDIHQQFIDRYNPTMKKPMKYRKRSKSEESQWFANGVRNPNKNVNVNKNPLTSE